MARLGVLMLATLAGVYLMLSLFGGEKLREPQAARPAPESAAQISGGPAPASPPAAEAPVPALVQAASQTPARARRFPGPALIPSPQYADAPTPAARAVPAPAAPQGPLFEVTGNSVRFRAGPSTGDAVMGTLGGGALVEVLGPTEADWVQIRDGRGRTGFMSRRFLTPATP